MQGHSFRLAELTALEKKVEEMRLPDSSASWNDSFGEIVKFIKDRIEVVRKDQLASNPMWPKGSQPYAE